MRGNVEKVNRKSSITVTILCLAAVGLTALVAVPAVLNATDTAPSAPVTAPTPISTPTNLRSPAVNETPTNSAASDASEDLTGCAGDLARYGITKPTSDADWQWKVTGAPRDLGGPARGASGTPNVALTRYTVEEGDTYSDIAARFCIDEIELQVINGAWGSDDFIKPGDVITLVPVGDAADFVSEP